MTAQEIIREIAYWQRRLRSNAKMQFEFEQKLAACPTAEVYREQIAARQNLRREYIADIARYIEMLERSRRNDSLNQIYAAP